MDLCGLSQAAYDLIVNEETGGQAYYEKTEQHPTWPGAASGVTIGCGYDCGYASTEQIAADWGPYLVPSMVADLQSVAGIRGRAARSHAAELQASVFVPWSAAIAVFAERDLPKYAALVHARLPNTDKLNGDCFGALVSLTFNRGASYDLDGDRYREMRAIKAHMVAQRFDLIPAEFRAMKRLWPLGTEDHNGLTKRREDEAVLFEQGLRAMEGIA